MTRVGATRTDSGAFDAPPSTTADASSTRDKPDGLAAAEKESLSAATTEPAKTEIASPPIVDGRSSLAAAEGDQELAEAIWVEGHVVIPEGTPADEQIEVVADGGKFKSRPPYRASLTPGDKFRVAFAKDTKSGRINLVAHHLYLRDTVSLKLSAPPRELVLEPLLGSCIRGHLVLPAGAVPQTPSLVGTSVSVSARDDSDRLDASQFMRSESKLGANLEFEFDGLPAGRQYEVRIDPSGFVPVSHEDLQPKAGATEVLEITLLVGARVAGRVIDEGGKGVPGAGFLVQGKKKSGGFEVHTFRALSTDDGSFVLTGIPPGKMTIEVSGGGFEEFKYEAGDLADGETRNDVEIVLRRGLVVSGRVQWPDGKPAVGCPIAVEKNGGGPENPLMISRNQPPIVTNDDGVFEVTGFTKGTLTLTAEIRVAEGDSSPVPQANDSSTQLSEGTRKKTRAPTWITRAEKVKPGTSNLVLVLSPSRSIVGRAIDDTGKPVPVFTVRATPSEEESNFWPMARGAISQYFRSKSGEFTLDGLHDGDWNVSASGRGYSNSESHRLTLPRDTAAIDLVLPRPASISGVIVDPSGHPVSRADAHVARSDGDPFLAAFNELKRSKSDEDGRFELKDLPVGRLKLSATADGWAEGGEVTVELHAAEVLTDLKLPLRAGGTIAGTVVGAHGQPDARCPIDLALAGKMFDSQRGAISDESGKFEINHLLAGRYVVTARHSDPDVEDGDASAVGDVAAALLSRKQAIVTVVEGETVHVVLGAPPSTSVIVFGVIRSGDLPAAGIEVWASHGRSAAELYPKRGKSDAQGRYELALDEPGEYTIALRSNGSLSSHLIVVPAQARFEHDLAFPAGRISGRVLGPDGKAMAGISVSLLPDRQKAALVGQRSYGHVETGAQGQFTFEHLSTGTYSIEAGGPGEYFGEGKVSHGHAMREGLAVAEGGTIENADLRLPASCQIEGVVRDTGGAPAANAMIFARDASGHVSGQPFSWKSDVSGHFRLEGLSPGRTTFFARTESMASGESAPVSVGEGQTGSVELVVVPATVLRVQVEGADHRAVASEVTVVDEHGHEFGGMATMFEDDEESASEATGGTSIGPLPPGRYQVSAHYGALKAPAQEIRLSGEDKKSVVLRLGS